MSKKKKLAAAVFILAVIALNVFIVLHRGAGNRSLTLRMTVESAQNAVVQVYYTADTDFSEAMSDKKMSIQANGESTGTDVCDCA